LGPCTRPCADRAGGITSPTLRHNRDEAAIEPANLRPFSDCLMVIASKKKAALLSSGGLLIRIASSDLVARVEDVARDDGTVLTPILGDLPRRRLQGMPPDIDADLLIVIGGLQRSSVLCARITATPPPGTMPSCTATGPQSQKA
jgi:hypothetical protein